MDAKSLMLAEIVPRAEGERWRAFDASGEFPAPWWQPEDGVDRTERWVAGERNGVQVVRCKFTLIDGPLAHPLLGPMPDGQLDILAFEVALSMRRRGIGVATLRAVREMYPGPRLTALNDDAVSRRFWDGIGWIRHEPMNPMFAGVERVTYSEV